MLYIPTYENAFFRKSSSDLARVLLVDFPNDPNAKQIPELCNYLFVDNAEEPRDLILSDSDRTFLENIKLLTLGRTAARETGLPVPASLPPKCGEEFDFLGLPTDLQDWSVLRLLNFLMMNSISSRNARVAVVVNMRDDGLSMIEWIAHYRVIGCHRIFVYSNDNCDGSTRLLEHLADYDIISYIENRIDSAVSPQVKTFEHAINFLHELRSYEWVFFLDSDEFFLPPTASDYDISRIISKLNRQLAEEATLPSAVLYYWKWVVSGNAYSYAPDLLCKRFTHSRPDLHYKALVRLENVRSMSHLHFPELKAPGYFVDACLKKCSVMVTPGEENRRPEYDGGQLNHYWVKSFEEYYLKKRRGDNLKLQSSAYHRDFETFFSWNGQETADTYNPTPSRLVAMIETEVARLLAMPSIATSFREILNNFECTVRSPDLDLRRIYESIEQKRTVAG